MKGKVVLFTLAILALAAVGVFAKTPGDLLPPGATNPGTWVWDPVAGEWRNNAEFAISFNSGPVSSGGMSNKEIHSFDIINHVSVAQWVEYHVSGTRKDWRILRPGIYASDSVTATIKSNNDIIIEFWATDPEYLSEGGVTRTIPKYFSYSEGNDANEAEENGWIAASETSPDNPYTFTIADSEGLHNGLSFKIWEKIEVVPSNSSSDYEGYGTVTIRLTNMKHWVDGETGTFYPGGRSPEDPES